MAISPIAALNDLAFEDRAHVQGAFPEHSHQYLIWSARDGVDFRDTSFTTVSLGFIDEIVSKSIDEGSGYGMPSPIGGSAVQSTSPTLERGSPVSHQRLQLGHGHYTVSRSRDSYHMHTDDVLRDKRQTRYIFRRYH